ncbi:MAG: hypothetical protein Q7J42_17485 [Sulfuritalea sp.]|nr:hypothetical protein [Sulfuritalea sp.]
MIAHARIAPQQYHSIPNPVHAAANPASGREHTALIVDGAGMICGCGAAVEDIFGTSRGRLLGKPVSAFIAGLLGHAESPGHDARYLVHLGADAGWRKFEATDARGQGFAVEVSVSRRMADDHEVFVLDLRQPIQAI